MSLTVSVCGHRVRPRRWRNGTISKNSCVCSQVEQSRQTFCTPLRMHTNILTHHTFTQNLFPSNKQNYTKLSHPFLKSSYCGRRYTMHKIEPCWSTSPSAAQVWIQPDQGKFLTFRETRCCPKYSTDFDINQNLELFTGSARRLLCEMYMWGSIRNII